MAGRLFEWPGFRQFIVLSNECMCQFIPHLLSCVSSGKYLGVHEVWAGRSISVKGYLAVQKVCPFLMFEPSLPSLPPSPASTISHLDLQFNFLNMSSENPDEAPQVQQATSPNAVAPLTLDAHLELIPHLQKFAEDLPKSEDPGFLDHHYQTLNAVVDVHNRFLMNTFCTHLILYF